MKLDDFLTQYVEGYLFGDLESMAAIRLRPPATMGASGYPMVQTTLAGMELLGSLLHPKGFAPDQKGEQHFSTFWRHILVKRHPLYGQVPHAQDLVYKLVRHGLSHMFLTRPGIYVTKDFDHNPAPSHMHMDPGQKRLHIDCLQFLRDFRDCYEGPVHAIAEGGASLKVKGITINQALMQSNLDALGQSIQKLSDYEFGKASRLATTTPVVSLLSELSSIDTATGSVNYPTSTPNPAMTYSGLMDGLARGQMVTDANSASVVKEWSLPQDSNSRPSTESGNGGLE